MVEALVKNSLAPKPDAAGDASKGKKLTLTPRPDGSIVVSGETFAAKATLKNIGLRWSGAAKSWIAAQGDVAARLVSASGITALSEETDVALATVLAASAAMALPATAPPLTADAAANVDAAPSAKRPKKGKNENEGATLQGAPAPAENRPKPDAAGDASKEKKLTLTPQPDGSIVVSGETFAGKNILKNIGLRWDGPAKSWIAAQGDVAARLVHASGIKALSEETDVALATVLAAGAMALPATTTADAAANMDAGPSTKRPKQDRKKGKDPALQGAPAKVVEELQKLGVNALKALLRTHDMSTTGTKAELVARCADGKAFGALPRCPQCSGGRIRFEAGIYRCPGYMDDDDFNPCNFKASTIERLPWQSV
eukprot:NODE_9684_length_1406_cov_4.647381.p2 GENE.NODE_9684_length_1406_cov_4.647381~~NODE_9684_length_1406_cov_4.647381.p2  ORF type:complete len:402 (+),score=111.75 NODE_9684_length_1406_cov_4.647381:95-1207(+)